MRYKEDNELHLDFHGTANTTFDYIAEHFGVVALKSILRKMGHDVYKSIREKLAKGDASELVEHINWFYTREKAKYTLSVTDNEVRLEVLECPAIRHIKKLGQPVSPYCCLQTSEVNVGMCEGTPWNCEVQVHGDGHCVQIFRKEASK